LNEKEYEILCMIAEGYSNREIAEELFFTEGTVKNYVSKILNTLHLRDRCRPPFTRAASPGTQEITRNKKE
jgi:DNA-binding NarL/FixJ family response regulator